MNKLTTGTLITLEHNQVMKEYKKKKSKNRKLWKKAFDSNNHQEATRLMDEQIKTDNDYAKKIKDLTERLQVVMAKENILDKEKSISVNVIFTYDNKDQDMIDIYMSESGFAYHLKNEVALVKWVINKSFWRDIEQADDLVKISMCVSNHNMSEKEFLKFKGVQEFLSRGGKYFFQPNQRGKVENAIIEGTNIASQTKPFNQQIN
jgi:ribosomal protein L17